VAEAGVPGYEVADWVGLLAPASTPQPIVDTLNTAIKRALSDPDTQQKFSVQGLEPAATTSQEFASFVASEQQKWAAVAKRADIRIED